MSGYQSTMRSTPRSHIISKLVFVFVVGTIMASSIATKASAVNIPNAPASVDKSITDECNGGAGVAQATWLADASNSSNTTIPVNYGTTSVTVGIYGVRYKCHNSTTQGGWSYIVDPSVTSGGGSVSGLDGFSYKLPYSSPATKVGTFTYTPSSALIANKTVKITVYSAGSLYGGSHPADPGDCADAGNTGHYGGPHCNAEEDDATLVFKIKGFPPTANVTFACTAAAAIKITNASDPDKSANLHVDIYEDGSSSTGTKVYSGSTSSGKLTASRAQLVSGGGVSTDWASHSFSVYILGVNNSGAKDGINDVQSDTIGPCATISCGSTTLGATLTAGVAPSFAVSITTGASTSTAPPAARPAFRVKITNGATTQSFTPAYASYSGGVVESAPITTFVPSGGTYTMTWDWNYPGHTVNAIASYSCTKSAQAGYTPYFNVVGGDIAAGPGFGTNCTPAQAGTAGITGENLDTNGSGPFFGAGTDRAAFATGAITSFATSQTSQSPLAADASGGGLLPRGLSFANTSAGGTKYGTDFKRSNWCMPDYTATKGLPLTTSPDFSTSGTRTYSVTGPYSLAGISQLPLGAHITVIVHGDAYITGDVTYADYSGFSVADIPRFKLIVAGGNLYIANTVQELHGFYAAQPTRSTNGHIHTCATKADGTTISRDTTYYDSCNHQLTIYGGVAAGKLDLERTWGNLVAVAGVPAQPAEQFVFTPELWLGNTQAPSGSTGPVQALTGLPPNL